MATEYGFVYILGNDAMPGIFKIGFTMGHPKTRIEQLSASTSCPMPFDMVAAFGVENPREVEQAIHVKLQRCRVNCSREFFSVSPIALLNIVRQHGDPHGDFFYTSTLEMLADEQFDKNDLAWRQRHFYEQSADPIFWPEEIRIPFD